jgi:pyruvate ferredoxin oxidoreductase beta subunit
MLKKYQDIGAVKEEFMLPGGRSCLGCGGGILTRTVLKALGTNIYFTSGSCGTNTTGLIPSGPMSTIPVAVSILGVPGAVMGAMEAVARIKGKEDTQILAIAGDGDTADIGFNSVSALFERGHKVIYMVIDNQGYSATGGQRSGTTELKAWTRSTPRGKNRPPKYLPFIMLAHDAPYVATTSVGFPEDIFRKVKKAAKRENQPAFIHCLTPCPTNWKNEPALTAEVARRAVYSGIWPLWEYERGSFTRTEVPEGKQIPIEDYLRIQGRYKHVSPEDIEEIREYSARLNKKVDAYCRVYSEEGLNR